MDFTESFRSQEKRIGDCCFHVVDTHGEQHNFANAKKANAKFPGAFDPHPDEVADDEA